MVTGIPFTLSVTSSDFSLFGHQLSAHLRPQIQAVVAGEVDDDAVPIPHMGVVLPWADWETLVDRIREAGVPFLLEPKVRFAGQPGEQGTFFVKDPSGNALEFKGFRDLDQVFATA